MKYLGEGALALGQDADGNVDKWYEVGDDIPDSAVSEPLAKWLVGYGFKFDPMPGAAPPVAPVAPAHLTTEALPEEKILSASESAAPATPNTRTATPTPAAPSVTPAKPG